METKNFYSSKGIIKNMKRQVTGWEKIFTIHIFDKELVSRIHKQVIPPIIKKNFLMAIGLTIYSTEKILK